MSELSWGSSKFEKLHLASDKQVIQLTKAKVYVFSDSVLCVGKTHEYPKSNSQCERQLTCLKSTQQNKELDGLDGEQVQFE